MTTPTLSTAPIYDTEKYRKIWRLCQNQGHTVIFNTDMIVRKLRQLVTPAADWNDLLDDLIVAAFIFENWAKQYGYPERASIREEIRRCEPEMPPESLLTKLQNQEILLRRLTETKDFWFKAAMKLRGYMAEGCQQSDIANLITAFEDSKLLLI